MRSGQRCTKLGCALLATACFGAAAAHEIPNAVTVRLLARPAGDRFQLLVRVPLSSMRDVEFPAQSSGYLDVAQLTPRLPDLATIWIASFVELYEDSARLAAPRVAATQVSILSDRSFASFEQALAHVREPLPGNGENLRSEQVFFDTLLEYPIRSERSAFAIRPGLEHLAAQVVTSLEFQTPDSAVRPFQFHGDQGRVPLDPSWGQAAWRFVQLGFRHILDGPDHLLFLLCLVIPFRRLRALVWIITAFTLAHSLTLIAAALGLAPKALWFPALIEMLIAATVVYTALENIVATPGERRRWILACAFGLVHGFGFAFALQETLQFAGARLFTALISFNVGVELGQLLVIAILVPVLDALFRFVVAERIGAIVLSALIAHTSWHWLTERAAALSLYNLDRMWSALRWAALPALAAVAAWFAFRWLKRRETEPPRAVE
ncbi:MAG: HupE/UreJ family protein [Opitutus sp.]|nr:HupE/UreJ family protein [Opitutus sp.]